MKRDEVSRGFIFKSYEAPHQTPFEKLFEIFKELITYTSGDFDEAIDWLSESKNVLVPGKAGMVETTEVPGNHVAEECQVGYALHERILRPAMVRVAGK